MEMFFMNISKEEINALTVAEKQQLLEMLWDSMDDKRNYSVYDDEGEESEDELQLLHERLAEYEKDTSTAIPWDQAFEQLKKRT
jgi:putative addiction module component (TIGR02574 family)